MELEKITEHFHNPKRKHNPHPLWFWNEKTDKMTEEKITEIMTRSVKESGYSGFIIIPFNIDGFMSDRYFSLYEHALKTAKKLGITISIYDENGFPSGSAGGIFTKKYPMHTIKRLDKTEEYLSGGVHTVTLPKGEYRTYLGTVAICDGRIVNITNGNYRDASAPNEIEIHVPCGEWKVMNFCTVKDEFDRVDYLSEYAIDAYIKTTYNEYFRRFSEYFGNVIECICYNQPSLYHAQGRVWTGEFNVKFRNKYGYDPITLYPSLWYNFGQRTLSDRSALMSFRTELFSENFIKRLSSWGHSHNVHLAGYMDQEENINPVYTSGDMIKIFEHQDIPTIDDIAFPDRAIKAYKLVSSSAYNYNKNIVASASYGAMGNNFSVDSMYTDVFNQFTRGINRISPHAIWYSTDPDEILFPPELSYRNPAYAKKLKPYSDFVSRACSLLQLGHHAANVAIIYPIEDLRSQFVFDKGDPYMGEPVPMYSDYLDLGERLIKTFHRDFTFLHPEILREKCVIKDKQIILNNEKYDVLILPSCKTISYHTMEKIKEFFDAGGIIVKSKKLPTAAIEQGYDDVLKDILSKVSFITLDNAMAVTQPEITFNSIFPNDLKYLSHIYRQIEDVDMFYIANTYKDSISPTISFRRPGTTYVLDPHTEQIYDIGMRRSYSQRIEGFRSLFLLVKP